MDELQISGKRFISSRRIAKENGYTADYVGQLIRGGKVAGQKVGRAWYVDAASFDAYLGGEGAVIESAPEPVFETAQPEANLADQKSSDLLSGPDPKSPAGQTFAQQDLPPAPVEAEEKAIEALVEIEPEPEPEPVHTVPVHVAAAPVERQKPEPVKVTGLRYYQEDEPSLPEIRHDKKESRLPKLVVMPEADAEEDLEPVAFVSSPKRRVPRAALALGVLGVIIFGFSAWLSSAVSLNLTITEGNAATAAYGINK